MIFSTIHARGLILAIFTLIGFVTIFEVPYFFPSATRTISASYDYGFNNTVGLLMLAFCCLILVGIGVFSPSKVVFGAIDLDKKANSVSNRDIVLVAIASLAAIAVLFGLSGDLGFGESTQFFLAMERISIGQKLYSDFDFYYGPLLAYVPYWLYLAGEPLGLTFKPAYFISLAFLQIVGLLELRYILNKFSFKQGLARKIFYAIALATLPLHSGINLILFRFITPAVGLILIGRMSGGSLVVRSIVIIAFTFLSFGISAEYGVIFSVALSIYISGIFLIDKSYNNALFLFFTLVSPSVFYVLFPGLFATMHLYILGAWRWPFAPSLQLILFFISTFAIAFYLGSLLRRAKNSFFNICFCLLAIGSLPAALGRCDPGHVVLNGLLVLIIAYSFIAHIWSAKQSATIGFLLLLAFCVFYNASTFQMYSRVYMSLAFSKLHKTISNESLDKLIGLGSKISGMGIDDTRKKINKFYLLEGNDFHSAFANIEKIYVPFQPNETISQYLRKTKKIAFLYFKDYSILASDPEVKLAIEDIHEKNAEFLLLPAVWNKLAEPENYSEQIDLLFTTKYSRKPIRNGRLLLGPLIEYIEKNYTMQTQLGSYVIMRSTIM